MKRLDTAVYYGCLSTLAGLAVVLAGCSRAPEKAAPAKPASLAVTQGLGPSAWTVPVDVNANPTQTDYYNFAWQSFIAVNWPALPSTTTALAQPDTTKTIGATTNGAMIPTVWLLYRDLATAMLAGAANPGGWATLQPPPPTGCATAPPNSVVQGFQPMLLDMLSKFSKFPSEVNQATNNPLIDQQGWYAVFDVRLDQSEYTFIQQNGYYNAANQINAFIPPNQGIQPFPRNGQEKYFNPPLPSYAQYGSLEVKAAWRVLNPQTDILSRYYTQTGYFLQPDGATCEGPVTFGLIGLHILRLTPSTPGTWFWSTFEQVDNVAVPSGIQRPNGTPLTPSLAQPNTPNGNCTASYNVAPPSVTGNIPWDNLNQPVNVCQVTYPIPTPVQQVNQSWQNQLQGTPFAFYQLDNTLNPVTAGSQGYEFPPINDPNDLVGNNTLANTSMETYFQEPGQSCLSCHGYGQPDGAPQPLTGTNQIFTFLLGNADVAPTATAAVRAKRRPILLPLDKFPHRRVSQKAWPRKK